METTVPEDAGADVRNVALRLVYPPLDAVTAPTLDTNQAAFYLSRKASTLRVWAQTQRGPLQPARIYGRLAWSTAKIREIVAAAEGA